jgi:cyclohexadieny/prephenate dehydrogenase
MTDNNTEHLFERIALIGIGLIGSSLARIIKRDNLVGHIAVAARTQESLDTAMKLGIADSVTLDPGEAVKDADLVIICSPVGAYAEIGQAIAPGLKPGCIVSDVGSVKQAAIRDIGPHIPDGVHFVPAHPVAGTEFSGPESGFLELFEGRWCIITPVNGTDEAAIEALCELWRRAGSNIEIMDAAHHDQVMAITSHIPHLIAYAIVGTATDLEQSLQNEVIKFSASGFRDFTRIASSDPTMWRDVFLNNQDAVLEMLQRLNEDITSLQRAIRWGEGDKLFDMFERTRDIRRRIIDAKQA